MVKERDFEYAETPIPVIGDGQARIKTTYLSLDPSMRGQMENRVDYVAPLAIGDVMRAGGVGIVDASKNGDLPVGGLVAGGTRIRVLWQHRRGYEGYTTIHDSSALRKIPAAK